MKRIIALLFLVLTFTGWGFTACHLFETNSTLSSRNFHTYFAKTDAMIPMPNYVTNGLTHWYDAQMNVGIGRHQNGDIAFWKDLVGNNDLLITSTNIFFTKKWLRCPYYKRTGSTQYSVRTSGVARGDRIPDSDCVTIEVCARSRIYYERQSSGYLKCNVRNDMYNMLVSNGERYVPYTHSYPQFIAFHSQLSVSGPVCYYGGPLFIIGGRYDGVRCMSFAHDYDLWGDGYGTIYDTFSLMFYNPNVGEMSPTRPIYQPYWSAKFDYVRFTPEYDDCIITHQDGAPQYSSDGEERSSTLLQPDPNYEYFAIAGSCYYDRPFYDIVYHDTNFWSGDIGVVRIYNRELTAEERAQNTKVDHERFNGVD